MQLKEQDVAKIYDWYAEGMSPKYIAQHFNITEPYVHHLVKGKARQKLHKKYFPHKYKERREGDSAK